MILTKIFTNMQQKNLNIKKSNLWEINIYFEHIT